MRTGTRRLTHLAASLLLIGASAASSSARPLYAARTSMACSRCHVDPAGGGMRNATGFRYAQDLHTMTPAEDRDPVFDPRISDGIRMGADLRGQYMQDAENELRNRSTFFLMQAAVYLAAELNEGFTLVYANDQGRTTEAFGLLRLPLEGTTLKVGRFRPAFGIEEEDHTTFTRDSLGFGAATEETGIEASIARDAALLTVSLVNGSSGAILDGNPQKAAIGRISWAPGRFGIGASGSLDTPVSLDDRIDRTYRYGLFGHLRQGILVVMGEYDRGVTDLDEGDSVEREAAFVEADLLLHPRLTAKLKLDRLDPDLDLAEIARDRILLGLESDLAPSVRGIVFVRATRQYGHDDLGRRDYGADRDTYEIVGQLAAGF